MGVQPLESRSETLEVPGLVPGYYCAAIGAVLIDLLDEMKRATSLVDVNIAAGIAAAELVHLLGQSPEQAGQLIQLPFNPG